MRLICLDLAPKAFGHEHEAAGSGETRGRGHVRGIVNRLTATGYTVSLLDAAEGSTMV